MSDTVHEPRFKLIEFEVDIEQDLTDSYGQWNVLRHSGGGVVH